jgi:hydrogenase-4 component B
LGDLQLLQGGRTKAPAGHSARLLESIQMQQSMELAYSAGHWQTGCITELSKALATTWAGRAPEPGPAAGIWEDQFLLAGFGSTFDLTRLIFPVGGALLALTGALAATAFVRAFGISFLALPRSPEASEARESHWTMLGGMSLLALSCGLAALCAGWLLGALAPVTTQLVHSSPRGALAMAQGLVLSSGAPQGGTASPAGIAGLLAVLMLLAAVLGGIKRRFSVRSLGPTWDCGLPGLGAENEYTATAFSKPLRMIFGVLYQPRREIQQDFEVSPYYPKSIVFESEVEQTFEIRLYSPLKQMVLKRASGLRAIQAGSIHAYLAYIFVTLVLLLLFGVRQ